ncbi:MAG: glycosyltransferase family 1 protein [Bacteroidales bacterium]|nr:glycosyltransferase family 1 protein [Bacteroidales bacterium]
MSDLHLHIVSFDIPYPANYGGVIDVFFKAKFLAEKGVKVHLHCFEYGRKQHKTLEKLFFKVHFYERDISKKQVFKSIPYIVSSRISEKMVNVLLQDDYPILMEGLHTSALLNNERLKGRKRIVRAHNIEHEYYEHLAKAESDLFKRYYYSNEASKLKRYEKVLHKADYILAISENDRNYFAKHYDHVELIPAFHPFKEIHSKTGKGKYVLYHGNLSVAENINAVNFLLENVFNQLDIPFIVAGLNPGKQIKSAVNKLSNVQLISNPDDLHLQELIENAHINISITAQKTGLKLKLLNNLYNGRFCLVNDKMLSGSLLDELCVIANNEATIKRKIKSLFRKDFKENLIQERYQILGNMYNNGHNVDHLIRLLT